MTTEEISIASQIRELRASAARAQAEADNIAADREKNGRNSWYSSVDYQIAAGWAQTHAANANALEEKIQ